jgi:hypothetical protein
MAVAVALALFFPDDQEFSTGTVLAYLALIFALIGALAGAGVAILVERRRR